MIARLAAVAAALALAACEAPVHNADEPECQVYRAFYAALPPDSNRAWQDTTSNALINADGGTTAAPQTFQATRFFFVDPNAPHIARDTSEYFQQVTTNPEARITACFDANAPRFVSIDFREPEDEERPVELWKLSPVAFAAYGEYALISATRSCGQSCGDGAFYLFERAGDGWTLIGARHLYELHN